MSLEQAPPPRRRRSAGQDEVPKAAPDPVMSAPLDLHNTEPPTASTPPPPAVNPQDYRSTPMQVASPPASTPLAAPAAPAHTPTEAVPVTPTEAVPVAPAPAVAADIADIAEQVPDQSPAAAPASGWRSMLRRERPTISGSVNVRRRQRRILSGVVVGIFAVAVLSFGYSTISSLLNPGVPRSEVQRLVAAIDTDGTFAPAESVAAQFLTTFLTNPTSEEEVAIQRATLDALSAGEGGNWVSEEPVPASRAQRVTANPVLMATPGPSSVIAGGVSLLFTAGVANGSSTPRQVWYGVVVVYGDDGQPFVAVPPSFMPNPPTGTGRDIDLPRDAAISAAASSNLTEFFSLWGQFGENATDAQKTRLAAFVTADPSQSVYFGMGRKVDFQNIVSVSLSPIGDPENPTGATGLVSVSWVSASGAGQVSTYQVELVNDASRWLIDSVTPV